MKQSKEIKAFIFSQYFSDGLRITFGVLLPSLLFAQIDQLAIGVTISLGAFCVSMSDNPGPLTHKKNGMALCSVFIFLTALLTGIINTNPILIGLEIGLLSFLFSMFTVYGNRASSIGTAALLVMILTMDHHQNLKENFANALQIFIGGLWYMLLSILVSQIRPYRLAQQALGECIREIASYMRTKATFYNEKTDYTKAYKKLVSQQITIHNHQDGLRELLFKSDLMLKESTQTGRRLILIFIDMVDLFEQMMASHYDYQTIQHKYKNTSVLAVFEKSVIKLAEELENISYCIIQNQKPNAIYTIQTELEALKDAIDEVDTAFGLNNLVLKKILISIRNISNRIQQTYNYFNKEALNQANIHGDLSKFVSHSDFDLSIFKNNLNFSSSVFRYALRMSLVCLLGYLVSVFLPLGHHSYWILLTILVILKPDFSLTKERNYQRLVGTILGGIAGACFIIYIKNQTILFSILLVCMIVTYSFQRLNYVVSVLFLTPYILILFSFLGANTLHTLQERIIDTLVGSTIALIASYFILPNWEHRRLNIFLREALVANYSYLTKVADNLTGKTEDVIAYKLIRKHVYVSAANIGGVFQRMLSEPKSKQRNIDQLHQFVVLNHMLSSYISNLIHATYKSANFTNANHLKLTKKSLNSLCEMVNQFPGKPLENFSTIDKNRLNAIANEPVADSYEQKILTDQLELVNKIINDLGKIASLIVSKHN